ncbi:centrosomal protein of 170 kDa isoform X2 [Cololabis saira]|uniref:centrosomal protein of 170 kDa isoform X2 n=1 Tax=Cololabis saira TaxID=129043 RepID=UPI002AD51471|nr:centrosomal protein of 170 kDa isoform X2 [Cololabis saira]
MSLTSWFLVSGGGTRHRLPREMIFVGRDDCELMLQSRSVDKQHAVINYDPNTDEHRVKDLGSLNGHEKLSSQLQLNQKKPTEAESSKSDPRTLKTSVAPVVEGASAKTSEASRSEEKTTGDTAIPHRGTPLYGQPAWWGDGDAADQQPGRPEEKSSDRKREKAEADTKRSEEIPKSAAVSASNQEPSYFEIPTKDTTSSGKVSNDPPSQEQEAGASVSAEAAHGHASFTIEFDPGALAKVSVKDRVAKVGPESRTRPKRPIGEELSPLQTAMVAAEVKVADWLAQNELPLALKETVAEDDGESVKSDVPVQLKSLKGSKHEDGTQSDSENTLGEQRRAAAMEERSWGLWGGAGTKIREGRANVPEGLFVEEDSPARRRKSSTSKVASELIERRRGSAPHQQSGRDDCYRHRDDYSDRGTYTIELENGDHEEEEARKLIDKVFGVDEHCISRLVGPDQRERLTAQKSGTRDRGKPGRLETEVLSEELMVGGPRWVSQWATLAASHIRTDPEGSGGDSQIMVTDDREVSEPSHSASVSSAGFTDRKRRTLPQLPGEELILGRRTPGAGLHMDTGEKQDTELQEKEKQEDRISRGKNQSGGVGSHSGSPSRSSPAKSQDSGGGKSGRSAALTKLPPRPLTSGEKKVDEARRRKKEEEKARECIGKPLLRQESFTVEKPSSNVPIELIPRTDGITGSRTQSREAGINSTTLQKDSEAVAAFLETTVSDHGDPPSQSIEGSLSPESDVDTTSTVSQADGVRKVLQKRRTLAGQQKEKTVVCSSSKGPAGARETQDRRVKSRTSATPQQNRPWTSLDLTDDDVNSNSLLSDSQTTSIQGSKRSNARAQTGNAADGTSTKSVRAKITQGPASSAPSKISNAPKPRPTRTSLLRKARMGDSSDTETADLDRMSVASEASTASSTSRTGMAKRGMSRIEALAQPRRPRVGSPSAQSDSEATVTRNRGLGPRSAAGDYAIRHGLRGSITSVSGQRARANSASKLPDKSRGTSSYGHVTPASGTRWRRVPVEYASTSEDEYGSNRHMSKRGYTRPFPSNRVAQLGGSTPATPGSAGGVALRQNSREQDEYMKDWTAHSEEIARISQDLAKDLAMLAREIHDVAGEIDSVSPAATDPGALLEESALDGSVDPGVPSTGHRTNGQSVELRQRRSSGQSSRSIRRQTWNRDDADLDSLLLASVTQLSTRIRQSVDKTTSKIRILFKNKERKWEEIEAQLQAEHDSLLLRSSNKEISTVIQDLKRVEKQLAVIDLMVDPDGTLDALSGLGLTSPLAGQNINPGTRQGAPVLDPKTEMATSNTLSNRGPEEMTAKPRASDYAEVAGRKSAPQ